MIEGKNSIAKKSSFLKPLNLLVFSLILVGLYCLTTLLLDKSMLVILNSNLYREGNGLITLNLDSNSWSSLRSELNYVYIDREKIMTVEVDESLEDITNIEYYITDQILDLSELDSLDIDSWLVYNEQILIDQIGNKVVYIKVTDESENITYINSDFIVLNGYSQTDLIIGRNSSSYEGSYITNKSSISINTSYTSQLLLSLDNHFHNLITNILLPKGTRITLIDQIENMVYQYQIPTDTDDYNYDGSCDESDSTCIKVATYPFTLFKEVGSLEDKMFLESDYTSGEIVSENFTIVLDFGETDFEVNYSDINLYIELHNQNGQVIRPTLYNTLKKFNIYSIIDESNTEADLVLSTDYSGEAIILNSDVITDINITSKLIYKKIDDFNIIDTRYEDKKIGLALHLEDEEGNIIERDYLQNIIFKVDEAVYSPENDNVIRIDLNSGTSDVAKKLTIINNKNNELDEGNYYLKINNYISNDGYYYDELNHMELSIPAIIENKISLDYGFDVIMEDDGQIIEKGTDEVKILFKILQTSELNNPNIRVSLFEKEILTAYNQEYSIIDLKGYITDELEIVEENIYYVTKDVIQYEDPEYLFNEFELNLISSNFDNTGYMLVFNLYDGNEKIATISKKVIVKQVLNEDEV